MDEPLEIEQEGVGAPAWAAFGDLMAGVLGAFVLVLAAALVGQLDLANQLEAEVAQRQAEQARREALERALAGPLADGRITLVEGRIGISGAVLFAVGSDQLHADGRALIKSLAAPLRTYLAARRDHGDGAGRLRRQLPPGRRLPAGTRWLRPGPVPAAGDRTHRRRVHRGRSRHRGCHLL